MSCTGQSVAIHNSEMPATKQILLRLVSTGWPGRTALGPMTRAA